MLEKLRPRIEADPVGAIAEIRRSAALWEANRRDAKDAGGDAMPLGDDAGEAPNAIIGADAVPSDCDPESDPEVAKVTLSLVEGFAGGMYGPEVWQGDQTWRDTGKKWESYQEVVAIRPAKGEGERGKWCCSGVLIAKNAVLTADHCFLRECLDETVREGPGRGMVVYFGRGGGASGETVSVAKYFRYAGTPIPGAKSDLAVLILARDVTDVAPAIIAKPGATDEAKEIVVAGFGIYDESGIGGERRFARVSRASPACAGEDDSRKFGCHSGTEFVAAMPIGTKPRQRFDTCGGDSGGPAYVQEVGKEERLLVGITSRGVRGSLTGKCGKGGIYTRLDREEYVTWIYSVKQIRW